MVNDKRGLGRRQCKEMLGILRVRFVNNMGRHGDFHWFELVTRLLANVEVLWSLKKWKRPVANPM